MPILLGPLRGARWIVGSGNHVAWLGVYEYAKQRAVVRAIRPGSVVYDVGAHAGFYSLLASLCVGPGGRVVAFEPLPRNLGFLYEHLRLNDLANVQVVEAAVADSSGAGSFHDPHGSSYTGRVVPVGGATVRLVRLDDLVAAERIPPPDYIKMDIEGGELHALHGARATLERARPTIFLATHGSQVHQACVDLLLALGYRVRGLDPRADVRSTSELIAQHSAADRR